MNHARLLPYTLPVFVETEGHDCECQAEVNRRSKAAGGQIALVLDGAVAAHGGHILRHGECVCGEFNRWLTSCWWRSEEAVRSVCYVLAFLHNLR